MFIFNDWFHACVMCVGILYVKRSMYANTCQWFLLPATIVSLRTIFEMGNKVFYLFIG